MKFEKAMAGAALTTALLAGCTNTHETPPDSPETAATDLEFLGYAEYDRYGAPSAFALIDCERNPKNWATLIDSQPGEAGVDTIAGPSEIGRFGATIRDLGGRAMYEIATSDHETGKSDIVELDKESYAQVIAATKDYSIVISAHQGEDGRSYFNANCLPDFDFNGDQETIPLDEIPTLPTSTQPPSSVSVSLRDS